MPRCVLQDLNGFIKASPNGTEACTGAQDYVILEPLEFQRLTSSPIAELSFEDSAEITAAILVLLAVGYCFRQIRRNL